jgi:hypothetical protein
MQKRLNRLGKGMRRFLKERGSLLERKSLTKLTFKVKSHITALV